MTALFAILRTRSRRETYQAHEQNAKPTSKKESKPKSEKKAKPDSKPAEVPNGEDGPSALFWMAERD